MYLGISYGLYTAIVLENGWFSIQRSIKGQTQHILGSNGWVIRIHTPLKSKLQNHQLRYFIKLWTSQVKYSLSAHPLNVLLKRDCLN